MINIDYTSKIDLAAKDSVTLTNWLPEDDPRKCFLTVDSGLNMKGSCQNSSCISVSYNMQNHIWLKKGYGIFDMGLIKNNNFCPGCQNKMDPAKFSNFGYRNAKITIEGIKLSNYGGEFVKTTEEDHTGNLIMFGTKEHMPSEWCQWQNLYFTVKKN